MTLFAGIAWGMMVRWSMLDAGAGWACQHPPTKSVIISGVCLLRDDYARSLAEQLVFFRREKLHRNYTLCVYRPLREWFIWRHWDSLEVMLEPPRQSAYLPVIILVCMYYEKSYDTDRIWSDIDCPRDSGDIHHLDTRPTQSTQWHPLGLFWGISWVTNYIRHLSCFD